MNEPVVPSEREHLSRSLILALVGLMFLAASPLCAQKVKVQANPEADFTSLRTYAWKRGAPAPNAGTDEFIRTHIEQQLAAKGFRPVPEDQADFFLTYFAGLDVGVTASSYDYTWPVWAVTGTVPATSADASVEGKLTVDMIDKTGKRLLWRGQTSTLLQGYGDKTVRKITKAIEKLFQKFPPQPK